MKNINNPELQEIADIAAQFVKPREGQHGAAQRAAVGIGAGIVGGPTAAITGAALGRVANSAMNSNRLKQLMLGQKAAPSKFSELLSDPEVLKILSRTAPVAATQ